jgi:hypothetical protein
MQLCENSFHSSLQYWLSYNDVIIVCNMRFIFLVAATLLLRIFFSVVKRLRLFEYSFAGVACFEK